MNYLIIAPRIVAKIGEWYQFPMGIAYISASLKNSRFNVFTENLNNQEGSVHHLLEGVIKENNIDVVMTGGLTGQYGAIREIFEAAKNIDPKIVTIAGGGIISSAPAYAMEALEYADYGVIGEGDLIIRELCTALEAGSGASKVAGVVRLGQTSC